VKVKQNLLDDPKYDLLFSVERVNELVIAGVPFRDAYKQVGAEIGDGTYTAPRKLKHSHEGSIGNLQTDEIRARMQREIGAFGYDKITASFEALLK
jgi:argininosuccinate lyase